MEMRGCMQEYKNSEKEQIVLRITHICASCIRHHNVLCKQYVKSQKSQSVAMQVVHLFLSPPFHRLHIIDYVQSSV